jgi:hypothetical protein
MTAALTGLPGQKKPGQGCLGRIKRERGKVRKIDTGQGKKGMIYGGINGGTEQVV